MANNRTDARYCRCGTRLARDNRDTLCTPCRRKAQAARLVPPDVPAWFWENESLREALDSWHMGRIIYAYRMHPFHGPQRLPQELVAEWLGLTQGQLSRIENGPPLRDLERLIHWAQVLRVPRRYLWFSFPGEPRASLGSAEQGWAISSQVGGHGQWPTDLPTALQNAIDLWQRDAHDSQFPLHQHVISDSSPAVLQWLIAPKDQRVAQADGARQVGQSEVAAVRAMRRSLKALDDEHGGVTALPLAVQYLRREMTPLLKARFTDAVGRQLLAVSAELVLQVGWMAYDADKHALARRYMLLALRLSHAADDPAFGGRILTAMSHQAVHVGRAAEAVDLARAAQAGACHRATSTAVAMMAAMEACALAAQRDAAASRDRLGTAEQALSRADPAEDPDWLDFDEGALAGHVARALRDLGKAAEAQPLAQRAVALCNAGHSRTCVQRTAILAATHLQRGELERGCALGKQLVHDVRQLGSRRALSDVAQLVALVTGQRDPAADGFVATARELFSDHPYSAYSTGTT